LYEDAWAAFIFGGIFFISSFFKPTRCLANNCIVHQDKIKQEC
jgi:hypothetical protein